MVTRKLVACCAVAGALGFAVGCIKSAPAPTTKSTAKQDEFASGYKTKLDDADKKLAELKAKADKATGDEKAKLDAKVADATAKRAAFVKKLDEVKAVAADKLDGMKGGVGTAFDEYKKAVE
jgi:hypothetical protein